MLITRLLLYILLCRKILILYVLLFNTCSHLIIEASIDIPLIGKDGDDVIDTITCELTGTESINTQTEYIYLCV